MKRSAIIARFLAVCLLVTSCATSQTDLRKTHHVHRVKAGETAYGIAKQYGVEIEAIAELNNLERPDRLAVGQELLIPGVAPRPLPPVDEPPPPPDVVAPPAPPKIEAVFDCSAPARPEVPVSDRGYTWPVEGVVIAKFGTIEGIPHEGLDIAAPEGTPIRVARDGEVVHTGAQPGYGLIVVVAHEDGHMTVYGQNAKNCVKVGDHVRRGDVIGLVGRTGSAPTPRVYFELRVDKKPVNPRSYLR